MCESTDLDQCLLKVWLGFGLGKNHSLPGGDALSPQAGALWNCCYRSVLSVRIKIPSIPQTTYWILETHMESPGVWKENPFWAAFLNTDCLLKYSDWFWFSSLQHSQAGIRLSLGQWCLEAAIQHLRSGSTEKVWSLPSCAAGKSGEHDCPIFAVFLTPDFHLILVGCCWDGCP